MRESKKQIRFRSLAVKFLIALFAASVPAAFGQEEAADRQLDMNALQAQEEFRWGVQAYHNGRYNEAILAFNRALANASGNTRLHYWLGRAYYSAGFEQSALTEWRSIVDQGAGTPFLENKIEIVESRRGLANELYRAGRFVVTSELDAQRGERLLFQQPVSIESRPDGWFYLTSFGNNDVLLFDVNGVLRRRLEGGLVGFNRPFDVVRAANGELYVSEFGGDRIARIRPDGTRVSVFGESGSGEEQLLGPQYMALDGEGGLYVTDWGNRRVAKFSEEGEFLLSFGGQDGSFPGFEAPTGVAAQPDRVFVADSEQDSIFVFDTSGNFLREIGDVGLSNPESIELYGSNRLLISDTSRIVLLDIEQETLTDFSDVSGYEGRITTAAADANGRIVAADFANNRILFLSEMSAHYSGMHVSIERVTAQSFPTVLVDVKVENRLGRPIVGLDARNFFFSENGRPLGDPQLVRSVDDRDAAQVAVVMERSPAMNQYRSRFPALVSQLESMASQQTALRIVSAGESPTLEAGAGVQGDPLQQAVGATGEASGAWSLDLGIRFAASELIPIRERRAIVFVSSGTTGTAPFEEYSLGVVTEYLKNNGIQFFPVYMTEESRVEELQFMARETGGQSYYLLNPNGIGFIVQEIRDHATGRYTLQVGSRTQSDFGRRFIPLEAEAYLIRQSGRDEAGYFAPLEF